MGLILLGCSTWKSSGRLKRHDYHRNFVGLARRFVGASWGAAREVGIKHPSRLAGDFRQLRDFVRTHMRSCKIAQAVVVGS